MLVIDGRSHDLGGGMLVQRVLPFARQRMVGPFIFLDHMGPVRIAPQQNTDVRPHPHIGLSTLTYLFEGRIVHRDSAGFRAVIEPGGVNWMTAGRGISHSERAHDDDRDRERTLHGLQFWVALPDDLEETEPSFQHYDASQIPIFRGEGYSLNLVVGQGWGSRSPVKTTSPTVFANVVAERDAKVTESFPGFDIGVYVIAGRVRVNGQELARNQLGFVEAGTPLAVAADAGSHFVILGGERFRTPRHIWWNLVSSSKDRIELAKSQWRNGEFPMVPGETEFIPLPER